MQLSMNARRAFTLVELLVVIAIIGILVSLLLPAVQAAREAGRRTQCANNLKQMGIAVQNFHDTQKFLPPARAWDHWATWAVHILPQLEQQPLYDQWDISDKYYNQTAVATETPVAAYFCPSRRMPPQIATDQADSSGTVKKNGACGDYAGVSGDHSNYNTADGYNERDWLDGIDAPGVIITGNSFGKKTPKITQWVGRVTLASVTDGTSNTALVGEKQVPVSKLLVSVGDGSLYCGDHEWNYCRVMGPGKPLAKSPHDTANWNWVFGGIHPGLCQFVFCDGSVRTVSNNTDTLVLQRISVRNDGQPIPSF
jgi:prepilin-type N-terminal cleavage/methylation domain-containing protein/prepilin-type processing-associated H-X9-DG protein